MPFAGVRRLASGKGRVLALAVSVTLSAAVICVQSTEHPTRVQAQAAAPAPRRWRHRRRLRSPSRLAGRPVGGQRAGRRPGLPAGPCRGTTPNRASRSRPSGWPAPSARLYPQITTIGGYRQDPLKWHPNGLAIDVMIPNYHRQEGIRAGQRDRRARAGQRQALGVLHVIWRQGFYLGIGAPSWTADYGNRPPTITTTSTSPPTAAATPPERDLLPRLE